MWFCVAWRMLHVSPWGWPHLHFTCHNGIVHSHQLCAIAIHSLAHFNVFVAFDGESEIQFLVFCWLVKFFTGFSKYRVTLSVIEWNTDIRGKDFWRVYKLKLLPCVVFSVAVLSWKSYPQGSKYCVKSAR